MVFKGHLVESLSCKRALKTRHCMHIKVFIIGVLALGLGVRIKGVVVIEVLLI